MAVDPRERYEALRENLAEYVDAGTVHERDADAIRAWLDAHDGQHVGIPTPDDTGKSANTLRDYARVMGNMARRIETPLVEADARTINQLFSDHLTGRHPDVKDGGLSRNTVNSYQGVVRKFYEYHEDLGVAKGDIAMVDYDEGTVDERDMFTAEEIQRMRDAAPNARDRCIFELLLYTGQRIRAIQTLRLKDVDVEAGEFYLNTDALGLKGAEGKRPLLGATKYVREWLRYHPASDDEAAYLLTCLPGWSGNQHGVEAGAPLDRTTISGRLRTIADNAGVDKPVNPHNFRHNFVTICKRDYGLDNDTIKWLLGHSPDSSVMETTYSHLTDEDYIQRAEVAAGMAEPEASSPLSPEVCDVCGEHLPTNAKACHACGAVFTHDAKAAKDQIGALRREQFVEGDSRQREDAATIDQFLDENPDVEVRLLERLADRQ